MMKKDSCISFVGKALCICWLINIGDRNDDVVH